jgi:hypothetical protein
MPQFPRDMEAAEEFAPVVVIPKLDMILCGASTTSLPLSWGFHGVSHADIHLRPSGKRYRMPDDHFIACIELERGCRMSAGFLSFRGKSSMDDDGRQSKLGIGFVESGGRVASKDSELAKLVESHDLMF